MAKKIKAGEKTEYSSEEGRLLLKLARTTIAEKLGLDIDEGTMIDRGTIKKKSVENIFDNRLFNEKRGVFVTLKINGRLRGCIGSLEPYETIGQGVINNAMNAAFRDPRFSPLSVDEFNQTDIEVSILSRPEIIEYSDGHDLVSKLRPGVDGVIISKGRAGATFLPQVWEDLPNGELFLSHLCRKAGLPSNEWEKGGLEVKIYHVQYFNEEPL